MIKWICNIIRFFDDYMSEMLVVLKPKHNLIGKNLIPVVFRLKADDGMILGGNLLPFARLKKEYPMEDYSLVELRIEFERLTGESAKDILFLVEKRTIWLP
jgi:hypothetical protein